MFLRAADRLARDDPGAAGHWLGRFVLLRLLGLVYLMAFLTLAFQGPALIGRRGLLPAGDFLEAVAGAAGSRVAGLWQAPSIFWLGAGDGALRAAGWGGAGLSLASSPFGDTPPRYVRVELYRYRLAPPGRGAWWERTRLGTWLPPLSRDDPRLTGYLRDRGWLTEPGP